MRQTTRTAAILAPLGFLAFLVATRAAAPVEPRVFELRVYHASDGKFEAMQRRFRDHTDTIFRKHGMTPVGYWVPQEEKDGKGQTLIYLLAFPSRDAAKSSWAAFSADPEWQRVKAESEKDGKLVAKVESTYLDATDYSPMR